VFDVSNAKMLVRGDVTGRKHLTMQPALLRQLRRECHPFKPRKFKERIYQEFRRVKFLNYYLEQKHAEKQGANYLSFKFCLLCWAVSGCVSLCLTVSHQGMVSLCLEDDRSRRSRRSTTVEEVDKLGLTRLI
jgi:hypothetical protein